jgi:hypothetical protein
MSENRMRAALPVLPFCGGAALALHKHCVQRRPFQPAEDALLIEILSQSPFLNWDSVAQQFDGRTPRQCRERWLNYLRPQVRTGPWSPAEDEFLVAMVNEHGRSWSTISRMFNGRSENDVKNRWYSHLQHEASHDGQQLVLGVGPFMMRPDRRKRRRTIVDPKQNALRLLEQQSAAPIECQKESDVFDRAEAVNDVDEGRTWFGVAVDEFDSTGFGVCY